VCSCVRPFTGKYLHNKQLGTYTCVVCGSRLFSSDQKFESGCGWPAFSQVLSAAAVNLIPDNSYGLSSTATTIYFILQHINAWANFAFLTAQPHMALM